MKGALSTIFGSLWVWTPYLSVCRGEHHIWVSMGVSTIVGCLQGWAPYLGFCGGEHYIWESVGFLESKRGDRVPWKAVEYSLIKNAFTLVLRGMLGWWFWKAVPKFWHVLSGRTKEKTRNLRASTAPLREIFTTFTERHRLRKKNKRKMQALDRSQISAFLAI